MLFDVLGLVDETTALAPRCVVSKCDVHKRQTAGGAVACIQASTIGTLSTGHVAAGSLKQALGPALVFELCKVL